MTDPRGSAESRGRCGRCGRHEPHSHPELWGKEKMPPGGEDFKVERATTSAARLAGLAGIHDRIAEALPDGGFLRCNVCLRREGVGDLAANLRHGWPRCCGYTMTWWTPRQIAAGEAP